MIEAGVLPHIISSDVYGLFPVMHDDSALDYSLAGAFARPGAIGMPFSDALAAVTINPARVLGDEGEIGTLAVGSRADVTVLNERVEDWPDARRPGRGAGGGAALDTAARAPRRKADRPEFAPSARRRSGGVRVYTVSVPAKMTFFRIACTPQFPSTTWVTPKSTATDISEIASSSDSPFVVIRK